MSKLLKNFIGIDISKSYFDAAFIKADAPGSSQHQQFTQNKSGFKKMIQWLKQHNVLVDSETLFCMEYTGLYNSGLVSFLTHQKAQVWVEMPLRIKKSAGFERGSNDKTSAVKIAGYAFRYQDKKQLFTQNKSGFCSLTSVRYRKRLRADVSLPGHVRWLDSAHCLRTINL